MRTRQTLTGLLWIATAWAGGCRTVPAPQTDRAAITALLDTQAGAWNRGDIEAFMEGYWRSPDLTFTSGGRVQRGFSGTLERYRAAYPDRAAMGKLTFDELEIHLLHPDAAWALGHWLLDITDGDAPRQVGGVFTLVFHRFGDVWRIVHDHTSALKPAAPSADDPDSPATPGRDG